MNIFFSSKKTAGIIVVLVLILTFLLGMLAGDVRDRIVSVTQQRLVPVYRVDTPEKKVAITLDGMWGADKTPRLLEIFEKNDVNITWFFGGYWLETYPDMVKKIVEHGHEIGNHSYTHPHCNSLSPDQIKLELEKTSILIKDLTGKWPRFFRPPFGEYNNKVIKVCEDEGYQVIQWSTDSLDWKEPGVHFIVKRILEKAGPGEIILMHNNGKHTADALEIIIPKLREQGYEIVPLSELVYKNDYYIESHSGVQKKINRAGRDE